MLNEDALTFGNYTSSLADICYDVLGTTNEVPTNTKHLFDKDQISRFIGKIRNKDKQ